jgi:hypothetical protein
MPAFGHLDLLADASTRVQSSPRASTSQIPVDPVLERDEPLLNGGQDSFFGDPDARLFDAWINPSHPAMDVGSLFGTDWDAEGAACTLDSMASLKPIDHPADLNTLFGATTSGLFSRASSPPNETVDQDCLLLPLAPEKAHTVCAAWKLKHVSATPYRPDTPLPPVFIPKQSANALSSELRLPKTGDDGASTDPIPSLSFVDLGVAQYFARFHPAFPIMHRPTFSRLTVSPLVLLSVLSIGTVCAYG